MKLSVAFILLQFIILFNGSSQAQWVQIPGISTSVYCFATSGNSIYAGSSGSVYLSTASAQEWTQLSDGLPAGYVVFSLAVNGNTIFAGTYLNGVYRSTNNGTSWEHVGLGTTSVYSIAANGTNIYAGSYFEGMYVSTDNGSTWTQGNNLLTPEAVLTIMFNGTDIFAGTFNGLFLSTDNGTTWAQTSLNGVRISSLAIKGEYLFAGTATGVFLSANNGTNWSKVNNGLTDSSITSLIVNGDKIYAGVYGKVFYSSDNGSNWLESSSGIPSNFYVNAFVVRDITIYAANLAGVWMRPLPEFTDAADKRNYLPHEFALSQNYPNPFNPVTTINYSLPKEGHVKLTVYNTIGSMVATLVDETKPAGKFSVKLNGDKLASGIYYYRMESGDYNEAKKFILIK